MSQHRVGPLLVHSFRAGDGVPNCVGKYILSSQFLSVETRGRGTGLERLTDPEPIFLPMRYLPPTLRTREETTCVKTILMP